MAASAKSESLNLRITPENDDLIRRAADCCGKSLTSFVIEAAMDRAQSCLLDQRFISVRSDVFNSLLKTVNRPARIHPELVKLFEGTSAKRD